MTLLHGDALAVLQTLPDQSVNCCITSPPYFGLRDYGTAKWEGGAADCDHIQHHGSQGPTGQRADRACIGHSPFKDVCGKCGAVRVDSQIGLERTPEEFIGKLVAVFREVRRVLRDDGTLFVNVGDSYASREMNPTPSRRSKRALAYGSGGTELQDSPVPDSSCPDLCDECQAALSRHNESNTAQISGGPPCDAANHDSERLDGSKGTPRSAAPGVQESTTREPSEHRQGWCSHCSNCGACLRVLRSSSRDASLCARRASYTPGIERRESVSHRQDKDVEASAYLYSTTASLKPKDLIGIPWLLAFALRADGWYLRQDIIWHKPNPMPESVKDRCTKAHEYIFLLSKSQRYYYDFDAMKEPSAGTAHSRGSGVNPKAKIPAGWDTAAGSHAGIPAGRYKAKQNESFSSAVTEVVTERNRRSVWTMPTQATPDAHFATFPLTLPETCLLAGCPESGTVLDPFNGAGTTGLAALKNGRNYIGIELNAEYLEITRRRFERHYPLLMGGAA